MLIDKSMLRFPTETCICGCDLKDKNPKDAESGFNEDKEPIINGFCLKCGRGYVMIQMDGYVPGPPPAPPAPPEDLPVTIPPLPEPPKKPEKSLEEMDYFDELIPLGKKLGIEQKLRKPQLLAAIKEIQASKGD